MANHILPEVKMMTNHMLVQRSKASILMKKMALVNNKYMTYISLMKAKISFPSIQTLLFCASI